MAALQAATSSFFTSCGRLSSSEFPLSYEHSNFIKLQTSNPTPTVSLKFPFCPFPLLSTRKLCFQIYSTVEEIAVEENPAKTQKINQRRKLFVLNLPWSSSVADIKNLFAECGTVADIEIIKHKDGKNRGFAFVTMASGDEAQAVIDKFDSHELSGRIIRVEFAKQFKRPIRSPPTVPPSAETHHKLYVSNLAWKVRSTHLREFFAANFNPVSARVVFESPSGRSAGYGFVSFTTREEAEAAISALDAKELLGRPLRLKFSERNTDRPAGGDEDAGDKDLMEEQHEES